MPIFGNLILKKTKPLKHTNSSFTDIWWKIFFRKWNTCLNKKRDLRKNMFWEERKPLIINTPFEDVFLFFRKWFSFSAPNRHLRNFFKDVYTKKKSYIPNYQPTNKKRIFENEFSRKPSHKRTECKLFKAFPGSSRLCTQPVIPAHDSTISFTVRTLTLQTCSTYIPHK